MSLSSLKNKSSSLDKLKKAVEQSSAGNGPTPFNGESNLQFNGSYLSVSGSGSTIFSVDGSVGRLFTVTDSLSGSLFSVNNISGLPILEVFSDNRVLMGTYGAEALRVSGSQVFMDNLTNDGSTVALTYNTTTKKVSFNTIAGPTGHS